MDNNQFDPNGSDKTQGHPRIRRLAWVPIPLALVAMAALWVADLRTVYESRVVMVLLNVFFTWLASACICLLTARGFLASGQPGLLMFGCGSLLWGITSVVAAMMVDRVNTTITVHNLGVFGAALCHLVGLLWRGRLPRPGPRLVLGYAGALMASALIVWAATSGLLPLFFVQGHGGTLVRQSVLLSAIAMFGWVAWQMVFKLRRPAGAFCYWYGLGLALVATGLTGVMLLSVQGGLLGWTNRLTQYLGSAYLLIAALVAARETGTWTFSLAAVEGAWQGNAFLAGFRQQTFRGGVLRYVLAVVAMAAATAFRQALTAWFGPGLPPYITCYPVVMVVALVAGVGPGLLATASGALLVAYWVLPPGGFSVAAPAERLGLVVFTCMGAFMSAVAGLYRRNRDKAASYDREAALRESQARLAAFAEATFEGILESEAGRILDCNEQLGRMLAYSVAELRGVERASRIAPEDRDRVVANIREGRESTSEHAMLRKDGTRIVVEAHGWPMSPGSTRRHTAIRDVTERKRAETVLQSNLQRFYDVLSSMPSGVLLLTDEGRIEFANQALCDQLGLKETPADLVGLDASRMLERVRNAYLHPDEAIARIRQIVDQGQPVKGEELAMQGGRTCLRDFVPLRAAGKSCGRLWVHADITRRKQTEEALRNSEERYRNLFNKVDAGFCIIQMLFDAQGKPADYRFLEVNAAFEKQTGLHNAQGKRMRELAPAHEAHWFETYGKIALTGEPLHFVSEARALNRWYDVYAYRVSEPESRQVAILFNDISEHKQAETELRRRAEELRAANDELTRFNRVTVGRELRIIELKKQVNELHARLGQPPRYALEFEKEAEPAQ